MYGKVGAIEKMATSNSKYTEDWLPIVSITNGMINLKNKYKVTGVKIVPRNIFILDPERQDAALIALKNFYNLCDFEFWIVAADRPVDISLYVSQLQLLYNQTQKPYIRKLVMEDLDKAQMYINNEVVDTEYVRTEAGKNMALLLKGLKRYIDEYTLIKDKEIDYIQILENYIPYALVLDEADAVEEFIKYNEEYRNLIYNRKGI